MLEGGDQHYPVPVPARLNRAVELMLKRAGVTLRPLRMKDCKNEVELVKTLYNACWEKNWGFIPMTEHEIDHMAVQFKPVVVPDQVVFAEREGKTIGSALALPDSNVVFRRTARAGCFPPRSTCCGRSGARRSPGPACSS